MANLSSDEIILALNSYYQPILDGIAKQFPDFEIGLFLLDLHAVVAINPKRSQDKLLSAKYPDAFYQIYQNGKNDITINVTSSSWDGQPVLTVQYPLLYDGKIIGHSWASIKIAQLAPEIAKVIVNILLVTVLFWLLSMLVVGGAFARLNKTFQRLAEQIKSNTDNTETIRDFPELTPVLETICQLRKQLEAEYLEKMLMQKEQEKQLSEQAELLNIAKTPIFALDKQWRFSYLNQEVEKTCGYSREELIGKVIWGIFPNSMNSKIYHEYHRATAEQVAVRFEAQSLMFRRWCDFQVKPTANGLIISCNDIEELRNMKMKYCQEAEKLGQIIEICPISIIIVDSDTKILAINKVGRAKYLELIRDNLVGQSIKFIDEVAGFSHEESPIMRALEGEEIRDSRVTVLGRELLVNAIPIKDEAGNIIGAVTVAKDVTEHEQLQREIYKLDRLNLIGEIAAGVAHEIRNPLTVIKGYLQFIQGKQFTMREQFEAVLTEIIVVEDIITDFLAVAGNRRTEKTRLNLNQVIEEIHSLLFADVDKIGMRNELKLDSQLPEIWGDAKEIKQLILNLVRNAIDALDEEGGKITIETYSTGNEVSLIVNDNGCGIDPEYFGKIFDPFFTTKDEGTGLGLAVCSSIVHRHNGKIEVESAISQGTSIAVRFQAL
jgi:two-component system, sporulation sensor kinase E